MYIADTYNQRIRKVTVSTGIITTIAGNGDTSYSGDNGPATSAAFSEPTGVSLDSAGTSFGLLFWMVYLHIPSLLGNVYIADWTNNRVRKVTLSTATSSPRYAFISLMYSVP